MDERDRHLRNAERALATGRTAFADALEAVVARHVPAGGTLTPLRYRRILDAVRGLQRPRYGARRGSERGSLYRLVAERSRKAWEAPVVAQAKAARRLLRRRAPDVLTEMDRRAADEA